MELHKILFLVAIVWFTLGECRRKKAKRVKCPPPNAEELVELQNKYSQIIASDIDDSFGRLKAVREQRKITTAKNTKFIFNIESPKYAHLAHNELCPSYNVIEYDPYRIPQTMVQAKCLDLMKRCENWSSETKYGCKSLYYYKRVLRVVGCVNGKRDYQTVWEPISVGCQCAKFVGKGPIMEI